MTIQFFLRFSTQPGQQLAITGNTDILGNDDPAKALMLSYVNNEVWSISIDVEAVQTPILKYRYIFDDKGEKKMEGEKGRQIELRKSGPNLVIIDAWNDESNYGNAFYTAPFTEVLLKREVKIKERKHRLSNLAFKVKAPLVGNDEAVCLSGNIDEAGHWDPQQPLLLQKKGDWWTGNINIPEQPYLVNYKYGIYNTKKEEWVRYEDGANRTLLVDNSGRQTIAHDGFVRVSHTTWKGAGVAIPVFALRSHSSFGIGEFSDIKLLADWTAETGLKVIQLLPVNDTSATGTWHDSYPYAAISAFALHPIYINLTMAAGKKHSSIVSALHKKQKALNELSEIDYEQVLQLKIAALQEIFEKNDLAFINDKEYQSFFKDNQTWLKPYAAFCYLRDKWGTADASGWKSHQVYDKDEIDKLTSSGSKAYKKLAFHFFTQYHLHLQLEEAASYAHKKGLAVKGDIPIGVYRYGCDAWLAPELFNMDMQAGAPPDDFTIKGQNWSFPTYNWKKMAEDHFEWWNNRFTQMSNYFDAFRIDHILGFFRIWSIPIDAVEGILGRFVPAIPVYIHEFAERGLWFDFDRLCKPWITDAILWESFGDKAEEIKAQFLQSNHRDGYDFKEELDTQRKIEDWYSNHLQPPETAWMRDRLFNLITNVILYEEPGSDGRQFHFRILIDHTSSYQQLDGDTKQKLLDFYNDYFYRRQDDFWREEAMKKLPYLKEATRMLICGEDLGMVPNCVPDVMKQLSILSLEIQRMPKDPARQFFHPADAPYMSVITPSTHDMSTIRGWWEEDRAKTQQFFNRQLGEWGDAPYFCEPWINKAIILQHLYSPAMWSIFQLQDIMGMSGDLRRQNPAEERINNPANPHHYWNYRMHITLEQLIKEKSFNHELRDYVQNSGRE